MYWAFKCELNKKQHTNPLLCTQQKRERVCVKMLFLEFVLFAQINSYKRKRFVSFLYVGEIFYRFAVFSLSSFLSNKKKFSPKKTEKNERSNEFEIVYTQKMITPP